MKKKTPISISNNYSQKNYLANALDINIGEVDNLIFGDESIARMQDQNMSGSPLLEIENQLMGREGPERARQGKHPDKKVGK